MDWTGKKNNIFIYAVFSHLVRSSISERAFINSHYIHLAIERMQCLLCFQLALLLAIAAAVVNDQHSMPVVGILTQPSTPESDISGSNASVIDTSYAKWLWAAGAVVVPIPFQLSEEDMVHYAEQLDAIVFTGGPAKPTDFDRYYKSAQVQ